MLNFSSKSQQLQIAMELYQSQNYFQAINILEHLEESDKKIFYLSKCYENISLEKSRDLKIYFIENFKNSIFIDDVHSSLANIQYNSSEYSNCINNYLKISRELTHKERFQLAYSFFVLQEYDKSSLIFKKLMNEKSVYKPSSTYYFSHIQYKKSLYESALNGFESLASEEKFSAISPYYIVQILFKQEKFERLLDYISINLNDIIPTRKSEVYRIMAESYYQLKDYQNSAVYYQKYMQYEEINNSLELLQVGHLYFELSDYMNAIKYLEKIIVANDTISQKSNYFLAQSYIKVDKKKYALNAFRQCVKSDVDKKIYEESYYNLTKLAFEVNSKNDDVLKILSDFLQKFPNSIYYKEIEDLTLKFYFNSKNYSKIYENLLAKNNLSDYERKQFYKSALQLAIQSYNTKDFKKAIVFLEESKSSEDIIISYLSKYWLADSYYQINNFKQSITHFNEIKMFSFAGFEEFHEKTYYNLAYNYTKLGDFVNSEKEFKLFIAKSKDEKRKVDATLRLADAMFMQKKYSLASSYYSNFSSISDFDVDYALYQNSICFSLLSDFEKQRESLQQIIQNFPNSRYYFQSLFDDAKLNYQNKSSDKAKETLQKIIESQANNEIVAKSILLKGNIEFNQGMIDKAMQTFKLVIENYDQTSSLLNSISALKSSYILKGNIDDYLKYISTIPSIVISKSEQDSLSYSAAMIKYNDREYQSAISAFESYLKINENGYFVDDVIFNLSQCFLLTNDTSSAEKYFLKIFDKRNEAYLEESCKFLARNYYSKKQYKRSEKFYNVLASIANDNSTERESKIRLMLIYKDSINLKSMKYAEEVLKIKKTDTWVKGKASMMIARYSNSNSNYNKARIFYSNADSLLNKTEASEAKYMLIFYEFLDENFQKCESMIYDFSENYLDDYYIAKSFILLSDILVNQGNVFQAKATLESILNNFESNSEVYILASKKLEDVINNEIELKTKTENSSKDSFLLDIESYDYDKLFEIE